MILIDSSIDIHSLVYANIDVFHIKNLENLPESEQHPYNYFVHVFLNQILKRIREFGASSNNRIILAFDDKSWRKEYFQKVKDQYFKNYYKSKEVTDEGYKEHREKSKEVDWKKIYELVDEIILFLNSSTDVCAMKVKNTEGDDIIGYLTLQNNNDHIVILSGDKDFRQLITKKNIKYFNTRKYLYEDVADPELFLKHHIIMGDKADEIPAVIKGVGKKKALKLLHDIDTIRQIDKDVDFRYEVNKKLIDLSCIPSYITDEIAKSYNSLKDSYNFDGNKIMDFLSKYGCNNLMMTMGNFSLRGIHTEQKKFVDGVSVSERIVDDFLDNL